jgi:hypothetical protein
MFAAHKAQDWFLRKMLAFNGSEDRRKYDAMIRAYNKFHDAVTALTEWAEGDLKKTDEHQAMALAGLIEQSIMPSLDGFGEILDRLESGEAVQFDLGTNNTPVAVGP